MKIVKPSAVTAKKAKNQLSNQSKFKSKDTTDNKLLKNVKVVSNMSKKKSLDSLMGDVVKVKKNNGVSKGPASKNAGKTNGEANLSPEIQLGLKLDKMLVKKSKTKVTSDTTPVKSIEKKVEQGKANIKPSDLSNKVSPSSKRKRRRNKSKNNSSAESENVNTPVDSVTIKNTSQVNGNRKAMKKKSKREDTDNSEDTSDNEAPSEVPKSESVSNDEVNMDDFTLNEPDVLKAIDTLLKLYSEKSQSSKKLMDDVPQPVFASFLLYVPCTKKVVMRFTLKNSLATSLSDTCLFVSDICKKKIEESKEKWLEILKEENVTNITEVIPLRSLMTEYTQYEDQRKLSCRFDFFLSEGKIDKRVNSLLKQRYFHYMKKTPTPVALKAGKMAERINTALSKISTLCKPAAEMFSVQIGHSGMTSKEILENIFTIWEQFPVQSGTYWENIREAGIFMTEVKSKLPIFINVQPPKGPLKMFKNMKWNKNQMEEPVEGELSTMLDKKVVVYPSGKVEMKGKKTTDVNDEKKKKRRTKKSKKPESSKSEVEEEGSDDDLGGRADMLSNNDSEEEDQLEFESDSEPENVWALPKVNQNTKEVAQDKGKKKQKAADKEDEDEDDDEIVDRAEEMYLQDLAEEKKLIKEDKKKDKKNVGKSSKKPAVPVPPELDDSDPSDEELMESEEEVVVKEKKINPSAKQSRKEKQMSKPGKGVMKLNKNPANGQNKKGVGKPGASKSPNQKFNSKKKQSPQKGDNKSNAGNFQGIKADQKTKQKKNKMPVKNKVIAKKLAN